MTHLFVAMMVDGVGPVKLFDEQLPNEVLQKDPNELAFLMEATVWTWLGYSPQGVEKFLNGREW